VPTALELAGVQKPKEWNGVAVPEAPGHSLVPAFAADVRRGLLAPLAGASAQPAAQGAFPLRGIAGDAVDSFLAIGRDRLLFRTENASRVRWSRGGGVHVDLKGARSVFRIVGVFAAVTVFWALYDQKGSTWVFQARQMDLWFMGRQLNAGQLQALNPFIVLLLIPAFNWGVFPFLERRGVSLAPLRKMTAGMFVTALSFAAAAVVQTAVEAGHPPHALWQLPQYLLLTIGEVLVSVTGLEFSYTQAPRSMRSTIMSLWFLAIFLGNSLTAVVASLVTARGATMFWIFGGLMVLAALAFRLIARRYRYAAAAG